MTSRWARTGVDSEDEWLIGLALAVFMGGVAMVLAADVVLEGLLAKQRRRTAIYHWLNVMYYALLIGYYGVEAGEGGSVAIEVIAVLGAAVSLGVVVGACQSGDACRCGGYVLQVWVVMMHLATV